MKCYLIAGEDSGDLHGRNLVQALQQQDTSWTFRGIGGDQLARTGMELVAHVKDTNFMGFAEVVRNLGTIRKLFKTVKADLLSWKPDALILIDYPGFNLRIARFARNLNIPVYYYISPQVWAWKKGRVKKIQRDVDRMYVILPFEEAFYAKYGVAVDFVGHPLLDEIPTQVRSAEKKSILALLPGSRKQEIKRMLPLMLETARAFPDYRAVVAGAPSQTQAFYQEIIGQEQVEVRMNQTYQLLSNAAYALVTSGTATLETALFQVPEIVVYKGNALSFEIGKRLVDVPFISLVNLIMDKEVVPELIQYDARPDKMVAALRGLMEPARAQQLQKDYQALRTKLGESGASARTASLILSHLKAYSS
ncbi:MAG: lipid-A-disaccharide synthase [Bacteroidota bacterium]